MIRYSSYKDSGVEWIGEIPKHWKLNKYKNCISILSGFPFKSEKFDSSNGFPIMRIRDISTGNISTFYKGDFDEKFIIKKGDVVILISASGNSKNLLKASQWIKKNNGYIFSFLGFNGGKLKSYSNRIIWTDNEDLLTEEVNNISFLFFLKKKSHFITIDTGSYKKVYFAFNLKNGFMIYPAIPVKIPTEGSEFFSGIF